MMRTNTTWSILSTRYSENYVVSVSINSKIKLNFCWQVVKFLSLHLCASDCRAWDPLQWSGSCRPPTKRAIESSKWRSDFRSQGLV